MSWTYQFDRIDPQVTMDSNTYGRATFYRYLYFKPEAYQYWTKTGMISGMPYSAQLLQDNHIPDKGQHLTGSLSSFYLTEISEVYNLCEDQHPNAISYGVVKLLYENQVGEHDNKGTTIIFNADSKNQPWEQVVSDFQQVPYSINMPFKFGYEQVSGTFSVPVENSARQPYSNLTTEYYGTKLTWSYATVSASEDFSHTIGWVNTNELDIGSTGIKIKPYTGLFIPPSRKRLWYKDSKQQNKEPQAYYVWSFEIIINPLGHRVQVFDAGTKMLDLSGQQLDICTWYAADPTAASGTLIYKNYGSYQQMIYARRIVDGLNQSRTTQQKIGFNGNTISNDVPLNLSGQIDYSALAGLTKKKVKHFAKYIEKQIVRGDIGWR